MSCPFYAGATHGRRCWLRPIRYPSLACWIAGQAVGRNRCNSIRLVRHDQTLTRPRHWSKEMPTKCDGFKRTSMHALLHRTQINQAARASPSSAAVRLVHHGASGVQATCQWQRQRPEHEPAAATSRARAESLFKPAWQRWPPAPPCRRPAGAMRAIGRRLQ